MQDPISDTEDQSVVILQISSMVHIHTYIHTYVRTYVHTIPYHYITLHHITWLKDISCSSRQPRKTCSCANPLACIAGTSPTAWSRDKLKYPRSLLATAETLNLASVELYGGWHLIALDIN